MSKPGGSLGAVAAVAAVAAVVVAYPLTVECSHPAFASWFTLGSRYPTAGPIAAFAAIALVGLLGYLDLLRWVLAGRRGAREVWTRAALLTPVGAAVGMLPPSLWHSPWTTRRRPGRS